MVSRAGPGLAKCSLLLTAAKRARAKRGHVLQSNDATGLKEEFVSLSCDAGESSLPDTVRPCRLVNIYRVSKENAYSVFTVYVV